MTLTIFLNLSHFINNLFHHPEEVFNPEMVIRYGGLVILFLTVFAQTGLFFCFFFPGDALLFSAGVLVATGSFHHRIEVICLMLIVAAFGGSSCGYWFGRSAGPLLLSRKDSWFFRQEHLRMANHFFNKYGGLALTTGLFLPIIRTFAPIVAGVIRYPFRQFVIFAFLGSVIWICLLVLSGYYLGNFPFAKKNLEFIVIALIIVITTPVIVRVVREFNKLKEK